MKNELRSGSRLGRYELLVELGKGGMASVWIAREPGDMGDRLVALKAMLPELAQRSDFRTMFLEEGQVVRSIEHPHVVRVYEVGEDRGVLFMAMEWVRGDSLQTVMRDARSRRPIPPEVAVRIIADTAAGLHAAHELRGWDGELRNLVHCDVSPHNILVGVDGRSRLVDFGVANGTAHSDPEKGDQVKGKFGYMSPEQANGEPVDRRTDVFALGIVLFELTTGERLFKGELPAHTLRLVQAARIPHPGRLVPDYPERLVPIVMRALERDRKTRYQTAEELCQALEQFLVTERLLISHAAVGKLVQKVLRPRLEQQDSLLQKALLAADGVVQGGLVPPASPQAAGAGAARMSDPSHPSMSSSPFQHKVERERRAPIGAVLFGALGVCSAVASIVWTSLYAKPNALLTAPGGVAASGMHAPGPAAGARLADGKEGVSLDSIPLAEAEAQQPAARGGPPVVRRTHVTLDEDPAPPGHPSAPEQIQLDDAQPAKPAAPAPKPETPKPPADAEPAVVNLEDQPAPAPAKPSVPDTERGPLNRGAAVSALAAAGGRAISCSSPDGPSGTGRAMVTFSPDGPVTGVALQPPFAGTGVGTCVVNSFKSARVPAFTGSAVTLPGSFRVP
ncbi:MAG TPA: serine/threonine-protein kinase [Polyangiaceae bacterium]|nr:serine/threonine-protein kinase [Polyangiaceae bacterium]